MGRPQKILFVSEANLYRCVMRSRKDEAAAFQDWIVEVLLPTIRKTGSYFATENAQTPIDGLFSQFFQLKKAQNKLIDRINEAEDIDEIFKAGSAMDSIRRSLESLLPDERPSKSQRKAVASTKTVEEPTIAVLAERLRSIAAKTEDGMLTAKMVKQQTRLIKSSAHAYQVFESLEKAGYGIRSNLDRFPRFQFR